MAKVKLICHRPSKGLRLLAQKLRDLGQEVSIGSHQEEGIANVSWGVAGGGIGVLNSFPVGDKLQELKRLSFKEVPVPPFYSVPPFNTQGLLGRTSDHQGGKDLRRPPKNPDFWVRKLDISQEFRVHVWGDKSMSVGMKVPFGEIAHPWIRSRRTGWHLSYGTDAVLAFREALKRDDLRVLAKKAIKALNLTFGAVDIGVRASDGKGVVFEVNRAPGLDNASAMRYARKIAAYAERAQATRAIASRPAEPPF